MEFSLRSSLSIAALAFGLLTAATNCQSSGETPTPSSAPAESPAAAAEPGGDGTPQPEEAAASPEPRAATPVDTTPGADADRAAAPQPASGPVTCKVGDEIRQVGESWQVECNTCRCTESGQPACTLKHCGDE